MPANQSTPAPRHPLRGLLEFLHRLPTITSAAVDEGRAILAATEPPDEIPSVEEALTDLEAWFPRHWAEVTAARPDVPWPPEEILAYIQRVSPKLQALLLAYDDPGRVTDGELDQVVRDAARERR